jgi:hypothetical protein
MTRSYWQVIAILTVRLTQRKSNYLRDALEMLAKRCCAPLAMGSFEVYFVVKEWQSLPIVGTGRAS